MHIELIDFLRCTNNHEHSHLVAVFHRVENREVIDATLGCPVCGAIFQLRNGVAAFDRASDEAQITAPADADPDAAVRVAAFLALTVPGLLVVMTQTRENLFDDLVAIAQPRIFGLTRRDDVNDPTAAAWLLIGELIPLASDSIDGIVLDREFAQPATISETHRLLKPGRRLVAPADTILPEGFREIARDDTYVVAERMPELIRLGR